MNPETFLQYITRKTGVGRTSRIMAAIIHLGCALFIWVSAHNYPDPWWWASGAIAVLVIWGFWWGTYGNYAEDQRRLSKPPNQNHYNDVCEGCDPVMYKDRTPITDIVKWYAADRKMSREMAAHILDRTGGVGIEEEHAAYLSKFPKP